MDKSIERIELVHIINKLESLMTDIWAEFRLHQESNILYPTLNELKRCEGLGFNKGDIKLTSLRLHKGKSRVYYQGNEIYSVDEKDFSDFCSSFLENIINLEGLLDEVKDFELAIDYLNQSNNSPQNYLRICQKHHHFGFPSIKDLETCSQNRLEKIMQDIKQLYSTFRDHTWWLEIQGINVMNDFLIPRQRILIPAFLIPDIYRTRDSSDFKETLNRYAQRKYS